MKLYCLKKLFYFAIKYFKENTTPYSTPASVKKAFEKKKI